MGFLLTLVKARKSNVNKCKICIWHTIKGSKLLFLGMIKFAYTLIIFCTFCTPAFSSVFQSDDAIAKEKQLVTLRKIGHQLLLTVGDTTSRVLPVEYIGEGIHKISFEKPFALRPNSLVKITNNLEQKGYLPKNYIVNVYDEATNNVQYAYSITTDDSNIPCLGRSLPEGKYYITVQFTETNRAMWFTAGVIPVFLFLGWHQLRKGKKKEGDFEDAQPHTHVMIGNCKYFPDLQKLEVNGVMQSLTAKETKVLNIFATNVNTEVTRERIQKEVWEDEGVIVGRSLDMFISKLRKKFKEEPAIQIVSIHGKGYKLIAEA